MRCCSQQLYTIRMRYRKVPSRRRLCINLSTGLHLVLVCWAPSPQRGRGLLLARSQSAGLFLLFVQYQI